MGKKKKKKNQSKAFSEIDYIKNRVRNLPTGKCYLNENWEKGGEAIAIVTRCHPKGTLTAGVFLIDSFCLGLKDSTFRFNMDPQELDNFINDSFRGVTMKETDYVTVHNLIYGAIEFAEEAGCSPDKSFNITRYILSPDTEDIPLVQFDFGKDGKHLLIANSRTELDYYLPKLKKYLGDDFRYVCNMDEYTPASWFPDIDTPPMEQYTYKPHGYPSTVSLSHPELIALFSDEEYNFGFPDDILDRILSISHPELSHDIEQMALWRIGTSLAEIASGKDDYSPLLTHSVFFLGELGYEKSLPVILEILRQNDDFLEYSFGDATSEIFIPTLYLLGKDNLDALDSYLHEPGLHTFARALLFPAVSMVPYFQPERRQEVIGWFRNLLVFYKENLPERRCCDGTLVGMLMNSLIDMNAVELLPEIKAIYDTGLVDTMPCGDYAEVAYEINKKQKYPQYKEYSLDIRERYRQFGKWDS